MATLEGSDFLWLYQSAMRFLEEEERRAADFRRPPPPKKAPRKESPIRRRSKRSRPFRSAGKRPPSSPLVEKPPAMKRVMENVVIQKRGTPLDSRLLSEFAKPSSPAPAENPLADVAPHHFSTSPDTRSYAWILEVFWDCDVIVYPDQVDSRLLSEIVKPSSPAPAENVIADVAPHRFSTSLDTTSDDWIRELFGDCEATVSPQPSCVPHPTSLLRNMTSGAPCS